MTAHHPNNELALRPPAFSRKLSKSDGFQMKKKGKKRKEEAQSQVRYLNASFKYVCKLILAHNVPVCIIMRQ